MKNKKLMFYRDKKGNWIKFDKKLEKEIWIEQYKKDRMLMRRLHILLGFILGLLICFIGVSAIVIIKRLILWIVWGWI